MDNVKIAEELIKIAKSLTAKQTITETLDDAREWIEEGGRGVELGIRKLYKLERELGELYKDLRTLQGRPDGTGENQQAVLDEFNKRV